MPEQGKGKGFEKFLTSETAGMPNWVWLLVIGAGLGLAYFVPKLIGKNTGTSTDQGAASAGLGLAIDPTTGLPYAVEGLVPSGAVAGTTSTPHAPTESAPSTPQTLTALIRSARINPTLSSYGYDVANPQGIPIRPITSGLSNPIGYEPFGSQVTITGPGVIGSENFPGATTGQEGSNIWYPVKTASGQTGYISGYDIAGSPSYAPAVEPAAASATGGTSGAASLAHFNYPPVNYRGVSRWPYNFQDLSGYAARNGVSFERLMNLNPWFLRTNELFPGQKVRFA